MAKEKTGKSVSVWNWIGTLLLAAIPVVNLITMIVLIIKARTRTRRNFAIAALALEIFFLLLFAAGLVFFGEEIITWLQTVQISL
ncbi:MAG TPA: hypothetical protein IAA64_14070 [Candidatus Ornithocaccomicrobium faecavium]|uniref:Uncharacterized protein n=1 Tax=Candidatus Ornithocaccomicrobium faecavium TaxID=2840890 RepID=A0A9D1P9S1_9FIRM|nr:hypothetical protein [Clostridiales bacterium]HIV29084.1 hypothetical protein [Candidatus Ornithocaccomicrobium faecavium]